MKRTSARLLEFLHGILTALLERSIRYPRLVLGTTLLFLAASLYWGAQEKIAIRVEDMNDPRLESHRRMQALKKDYGFEDKLTIVFAREKPLEQADYCRLKTWLDELPAQIPAIAETASVFNLRAPDYRDKRLFYPLTLEDPCSGIVDLAKARAAPGFDYFAATDNRDTLVDFRIRENPVPFRHGAFDYAQVESIVAKAKRDLPEFHVIAGGTLFFQASVLRGIEWAEKLNLIVAALLFVVFYFFYRSARAGFVLLGMILVTNALLKGGMGFFGHPIDPLSSCLFMMITVAIIEDFVFVCHVVREENRTFLEAVKKLLVSSFLTSLTTAIGFGSLALSPNPNVIHFGIWTCLGAMLEWGLLFLVFPALLAVFPRAGAAFTFPPRRPGQFLARLSGFKFPRAVTVGLAALPFVLGIFALQNAPNLGFSPFHLFGAKHELNVYRDHVLRTRNGEGEVSLLFERNNPDEPEILRRFAADPFVSKIYSRDVLDPVLAPLPPELHGLIREDFARTGFGTQFTSRSSDRAILVVKSYDAPAIEAFEKRAREICGARCSLTSEVIVSKDYAQGLLRTLYDSFAFCLILVSTILLWITFAVRARAAVPVLISGAWAALFLISLILIFNFRIDVVTSVALSVLIGLTGDNAIQFLLLGSDRLQAAVANYGRAALQSYVLMVSIASLLFLSYFHSPKVLAVLLTGGLTLMVIGDLWIFSGLLDLRKKDV